MDDIEKKGHKRSAVDAAMDYISRRMRTEKEVRARLREKDYSHEEIDDAIQTLLELKYLDDYEYALSYFAYAFQKGKAKKLIEYELEEKGVSYEKIGYAYEDYIEENKVDEYEMALEIAMREKEKSRIFREKDIARIARRLESRAYSSTIIYRVISEMKKWIDMQEQ